MFRLWAKEYDEKQRIIKSDVFEFKQEFDAKLLGAYAQVVCNEWKTETPMVLSSHIASFEFFNRVKFTKADFVDTVDFNFLTIQLIA